MASALHDEGLEKLWSDIEEFVERMQVMKGCFLIYAKECIIIHNRWHWSKHLLGN